MCHESKLGEMYNNQWNDYQWLLVIIEPIGAVRRGSLGVDCHVYIPPWHHSIEHFVKYIYPKFCSIWTYVCVFIKPRRKKTAFRSIDPRVFVYPNSVQTQSSATRESAQRRVASRKNGSRCLRIDSGRFQWGPMGVKDLVPYIILDTS